jgi:hypothetical protein
MFEATNNPFWSARLFSLVWKAGQSIRLFMRYGIARAFRVVARESNLAE